MVMIKALMYNMNKDDANITNYKYKNLYSLFILSY